MSGEVNLRPATEADRDLLRYVYASTREDELAATGWTVEERDAFLDQQFEAQDRQYREHYAGAVFSVVELDGEPVGRLYVMRWPGEIRVMDIALLPTYRGRGIGGALLGEILAEGQATGRVVTVHVELFNPARRLYERLGFRAKADRGVYQLLEWRPTEGA